MTTFRDTNEEALYFRRTQLTKYTHVYSITLQMATANATTGVNNLEPILQVMEDADFHITHLSGSVTEMVDTNGKRETSTTDYGLIFPMAGAPTRGDRGIFFRFFDVEMNRSLQRSQSSNNAVIAASQFTSAYDKTLIAFNDVFTPGYGHAWGKPIKFDYTLMKNTRLKVMLQSRQRGSGLGASFSRVSMAFIGCRYAH